MNDFDTIIFDTETTGLLNPEVNDLSAQPYIAELYAVRVDPDFNIVSEIDTFIKPPIPIPEITTKITGITQSMVDDAPTFAEIFDELAGVFRGAKRMVAHNLAFDRSMLANELLRIDKVLNFPWPTEHVCTVNSSMDIHGYRLNLAKLHKEVTGEYFEDAHRAKNDVMALVRSYHGLIEKGYIKPVASNP